MIINFARIDTESHKVSGYFSKEFDNIDKAALYIYKSARTHGDKNFLDLRVSESDNRHLTNQEFHALNNKIRSLMKRGRNK